MNNFYNNSNKELIRLWGEKLKELRLEANLSQASLAEQAGLGRNSVAEIEKGRNFFYLTFSLFGIYFKYKFPSGLPVRGNNCLEP